MPRTKPSEQRRADLLAAAQALFVQKGTAATTMEEITTAAGVSKGLLYLYFRSKDDLLAALQDQFSERMAEHIRQATAEVGDWAGKLDACVTVGFESYRDLRELHAVLFRNGTHHAEEEPSDSPLIGSINQLLRDGVEAGAYQVDDLDSTAVLLYIAMHAFAPASFGTYTPDDAKLVRATQQLFRRAVGITQSPTDTPKQTTSRKTTVRSHRRG